MQTALITFLVDQDMSRSTERHRAGETITTRLLKRSGTVILVAADKRILSFDTAQSDLFHVDVYSRPQTV
jgi:hypothetical protein